MAITLTEKAAQHVQSSLQKRGGGLGLRLGVKTSGCSGFSYVLEFVDKPEAHDEVFECHRVKIFIDKKSLPLIDGTELDLEKQGLNTGFKFNNPKATGTCGCGESFAVS